MTSPDIAAAGMTADQIDPMRYDIGWYGDQAADPVEVGGLLRAMMPENVRVLDVGAGTGGGTLTVNAGKNNRLIAVEPDEARAQLCRSRGIETYTGLLDAALAERIGTVDTVVFSDVLEHLAEPAALLRLVHGMLSDGGLVLASVPNVAHWSVRRDLLMGRFEYQETGLMDATHLRWFTSHSLRALFEHSGFEVLDFRHTAGAWLPEYDGRLLRRIPFRYRRRAVALATRAMPHLFGCQHIVKARKR